MGMTKSFGNTVVDDRKKKKEEKPTKLTVLDEQDPNTIYNLIIAEKTVPPKAN